MGLKHGALSTRKSTSTSTLSQGAMQLKSNMLSGLQKFISLKNYNKQDFLKSVRNAKEPDKDKSVFIRQIPSVILTQMLEFILKIVRKCETTYLKLKKKPTHLI